MRDMPMTHIQRSDFINAMRGVANAVTVVTTDGELGAHGTTVSAFASVSADPPMVLVCLHGTSKIAQLVQAHQKFCVNILSQEHKNIANRFAGFDDAHLSNRFDGIPLNPEYPDQPVIAASTAFICRCHHITPAGSHLVIIADVIDVIQQDLPPLTYFNGAYHGIHRLDPGPLCANAEKK